MAVEQQHMEKPAAEFKLLQSSVGLTGTIKQQQQKKKTQNLFKQSIHTEPLTTIYMHIFTSCVCLIKYFEPREI